MNKTRRLLPWAIWSCGALFFFIEYFVRVSPSVIAQNLMAEFHVKALALGGLSAFFYYAYIGMQIPVGALVDRFGAKRPMMVATLLCAIGSLAFAVSTNIFMADLSRFIIGFGAAFAFVGTLKWVSEYFKAQYFALLAGITQALGMLGASIGDAPMALVFRHFGWRPVMAAIAVLFLIISIVIYFLVNSRAYSKQQLISTGLARNKADCFARKARPIKIWASIKTVLSNRYTWINCLFIGCLYGPTNAFAELWGVSFIRQGYQLDLIHAALAIGMIFIGMAIGCPLQAWISNKMGRRLPIMRFSAVSSLILLTLVIYGPSLGLVPLSGTVLFWLCLIYGLCNSGIVPSYALASEINPHRLTGIALSVTNMASITLGSILIPILGWAIHTHWSGHMSHGAPVYSSHDYQRAFIVLPICFIIAFISSFFIKETYAKPTIGPEPDEFASQ